MKNIKDDLKTMLKEVVRKYESKLKHVKENLNEKLKESNKMLEDVTREYDSKLKNVEEDSNKILNAVNKFSIEHVIASSCIFAENKTSESIVDAIKDKVSY